MPPSRPLPMVSFAPLVEKTLPAVVSVLVVGETLVPAELKPGQPAPEPQKRPFRSGGSGVIVNAELGLIGTNHHVVRDAISITVRLHDGRRRRPGSSASTPAPTSPCSRSTCLI